MDINDFCIVSDFDLIFVSNEEIQISAYYTLLGLVSRWYSFLDNLY